METGGVRRKGGADAVAVDGGGRKSERKKKKKGRADSTASRAAESMLRTVVDSQYRLVGLADNKALIVLTISAAVVVYGSERLSTPTFRLGGLALLVSGLLTSLFAILVITPPRGRAVPELPHPRFNLFNFFHYTRLPHDTFQTQMQATMETQQPIHYAMVKDLYYVGQLLATSKYWYLSYADRTFLRGLVISALLTSVSLLMGVANWTR